MWSVRNFKLSRLQLISMVSKVFKTMLTGPWKEAKSKEIKLPGKSLQAVVWLLDFVYPRTKLKINGKT